MMWGNAVRSCGKAKARVPRAPLPSHSTPLPSHPERGEVGGSEGRQRAGGGNDSSAPSRRAAWLRHAEVRAALVDIAVVIINAVVNNIIIVIVTMMKAKMNNDVNVIVFLNRYRKTCNKSDRTGPSF